LRKLVIGALVGVLALAVAAIALADTTQTYKQAFSSKKAGKSVGTAFKTDSSDASNTANNQQPKAVRTFNIKFPAGTKVDYKAAPVCKASDNDMITAGGKAACPKAVIGAGSATVKLPFAGLADINAKVTAFNAKNALILYVDPSPTAQPIILHPKFKGNLKNGPTLSTVVPPNCLASTNQGGKCVQGNGQPGQEAILNHFDLSTVSKKKGKHVLIKSPAKCKGTWKFTANLKYVDGSSKKIDSLQPCKKTKKKK
jgi:hypothetical protein